MRPGLSLLIAFAILQTVRAAPLFLSAQAGPLASSRQFLAGRVTGHARIPDAFAVPGARRVPSPVVRLRPDAHQAQLRAVQSPPSSPDLQLRVGVARPGGGYTQTTIALETYVARVLAGEAARDSQPAALEALAIAVRTFTLANRGRHRADGFDLCDETHCQVMRAATEATTRAAVATAGLALLSGGVPASIYYSASCGGRTEVPSAVWPGAKDPPYMPSQPDDACGGTPVWAVELTAADLLRALRVGVGPCRPVAAGRFEARLHLWSGPQNGGRQDARMAARQEHGI
jgi:hypothetical protein